MVPYFVGDGKGVFDPGQERKAMSIKVSESPIVDITTTSIRTSATRNGPTRRKIYSSTCRMSSAISGPLSPAIYKEGIIVFY